MRNLELDLPAGTDPYSSDVYARARANFDELRRQAPLIVEDAPSLYFYRLRMGTHEQTGIAGCFSVDEYENDVIKLSCETIVSLAQILGASADELLGLEKPSRAAGATIKNRRIYRQLQSIDRLPKRDQEALARTIDAFLAKGQ